MASTASSPRSKCRSRHGSLGRSGSRRSRRSATAARFGYALAAAEGIAKKEIGVFDRRIPPLLKRLAPLVPAGHAMAILMVAEPQAPALAEMVADHGGRIVYERSAADAEAAAFEGKGALPPLYEYTWNHTTLHALKVEPAITYLQIRFPEGGELRLVEEMERVFGDEMLLHLEFQRRFGRVFLSSLPLLRYRSPERLARSCARSRRWAARCRTRTPMSSTMPAGSGPTRPRPSSRASPIRTG